MCKKIIKMRDEGIYVNPSNRVKLIDHIRTTDLQVFLCTAAVILEFFHQCHCFLGVSQHLSVTSHPHSLSLSSLTHYAINILWINCQKLSP